MKQNLLRHFPDEYFSRMYEWAFERDDQVKIRLKHFDEEQHDFSNKFIGFEENISSFSIGATSQENVFNSMFPNLYIQNIQDGFQLDKIIIFKKSHYNFDRFLIKYPRKFRFCFKISDQQLNTSWRKQRQEYQYLLKQKYNKISNYYIEIEIANIEIIEYTLQEIDENNSEVQMMMKLTSPCTFYYQMNEKGGCYKQISSLCKIKDDDIMNSWNFNQIVYVKFTSENGCIQYLREENNQNHLSEKFKKVTNFSSKLLNSQEQVEANLLNLKQKCDLIKRIQAQTNFHTNFCVMQIISAKLINIFTIKLEFIKFLQTINQDNNQDFGMKFRHFIQDYIQQVQLGVQMKDFLQVGDEIQHLIVQNWDEFYNDLRKTKLPENNDGMIEPYSVTITPTFKIYNINTQQFSNTIIRQNLQHQDKFLKVDFKDDNLEDIGLILQRKFNFQENILLKQKNFLSNFVWNPISEGINILNMNYQFLGNSNSSLQQQSIWMFNTSQFQEKYDENWINYDGIEELKRIQDSFGHLPKIFPSQENIMPVKRMALHTLARAAQLFTGTRYICELKKTQIEYIGDIVNYRKGNFTDGNGCISQELANRINRMYGLEDCSAYQFRLGGCKGTLVVNQELQEEVIQIRNTMKKFENSDTSLNIARCATPSKGFLNRQLISLLEHQGIALEDIQQILESSDEMQFMNQIHNNQVKVYDNEYPILQIEQSKFSNLKLTDTQKELLKNISEDGQQVFKTFVEKRMKVNEDPFMRDVSKLLQHQITSPFKLKGRIHVQDSAILIGVADYLQILQPGEIFLQVRDSDFNEESEEIYKVITGDVIITRSPCLHPNDVMKVKAVDCSLYKHLKDVVVFSANGYQPIQSQLARGDLDGDVFHIIWNKTLVSKFMPQFSVRDLYDIKGYKYIQEKYNFKTSQIADTILHFFKNNYLGKIDSLHLAICDTKTPHSKNALNVEFQHQQAVGFQKHGSQPDIVQYFISRQQGLVDKKYPDFMQHKSRKSYQSVKIMGVIFRTFHIHSDTIQYTDEEYSSSIQGQYQINDNLITKISDFTQHLCILNQAVVNPFIQQIKEIMIKYHLSSEAELICPMEIQDNKNESQIQNYHRNRNLIKNSLQETINKYKEILKYYADKKQVDGKIIAQAIYFITYFNQNLQDISLLTDENYKKFRAIKIKEHQQLQNEDHYSEVQDLVNYKRMMRKVRKGSQKHLKIILKFKKIFCVPWLLCHDDLI